MHEWMWVTAHRTRTVTRCWCWAEIIRSAQMVIDSTPEPLSWPLRLVLFLFPGHQNLSFAVFGGFEIQTQKWRWIPAGTRPISLPQRRRTATGSWDEPLPVRSGRCSFTINISFPCKTNSYTSFLLWALLLTVTQRVVCDGCRECSREKWLVENNHNSARHRKILTAAVRVPHWEVRLRVVTGSLCLFEAWWITQICSAVEKQAVLYYVQNYHDTTTPISISAKWRLVEEHDLLSIS